jgi:MoaA/NifB/PqqE/SkfB family radical SAM enzyme
MQPQTDRRAAGSPTATILNPFVQREGEAFRNPLNETTLLRGEPLHQSLEALVSGSLSPELLDAGTREALESGEWLLRGDVDPSTRYHLRVVSLETNTVCNQGCYFCPVSIDPRDAVTMSDALFDSIIDQLTAYRSSIEGVFLQSYNEPTVDRRFVEHCRRIIAAGLPAAVLSNASGLLPAKVDALAEFAPLRYLCINLSTLDREQYARDRGADHLQIVLRNLDYAKDRRVADEMKIVVLGTGDEVHGRDFEAIRDRFAGSNFRVEQHVVMDRAGYLEVGLRISDPSRRLRGCDNLGSRPLQHLHITPAGRCVLCCEDYDEKYVVGDLNESSVDEVLTGASLAQMRRWAYGLEEAPEDFICRRCIFARFEE